LPGCAAGCICIPPLIRTFNKDRPNATMPVRTMIEPWRELYLYWQSKHVDGRPPSRDELDPPLEIPQQAHNLLLIDILPHGLEYRLVGTNFVKGAGVDMTGAMVGSTGRHAHVIDVWKAALVGAHETSQPRLLAGRFAPHITAGLTMLPEDIGRPVHRRAVPAIDRNRSSRISRHRCPVGETAFPAYRHENGSKPLSSCYNCIIINELRRLPWDCALSCSR
jgi:hypothetical protein